MTESTNKPSVGFWVISVVSLIWNLMGVNAYIQQAYITDGFKAAYTEAQLEIIANLPTYYTALFAIAVFSSSLGSILLILKKKSANLLFKLGLLVILIQTVYNLFINEGKEFYGAFEYSMLVSIPVVALFLVWYSKKSTDKGWLS